MTVLASTISGNAGGGIYSDNFGTATLGATIVAGNTGSTATTTALWQTSTALATT